MAIEKKTQIIAYIKNRLSVGSHTLKAMTIDGGRLLLRRNVALVIDKYIRDYQNGKKNPRWIIIPGLRGVGKTTLLAQTYTRINCKDNHKLYVSLDDAARTLDVEIADILLVYEELLGGSFETLNEPVYIFLDEVQYDETWGLTLKTLYDRASNVFIICTGSSALSLQTNPDIARRVVTTKIFPLNFSEYEMIKRKKLPINRLGHTIREILFNGNTAEEVFNLLQKHASEVKSYWQAIPEEDLSEYFKFGSLPFALSLGHEPLIYSQINQTLNSILNRDVPQLNSFDKQTIDRLSQILYMIASYETTSFRKISETLNIDLKTVISIFNAFEKTELLLRVLPNGSHESQSKNPSKYLFTSPAFRSMYYNLIGSTASLDNYKGKLLEDTIGMYLYRVFYNNTEFSITYDLAEGGADFIVGNRLVESGKIIIEAGFDKKGFNQIYKTMSKVNSKYGLLITTDRLWLDKTKTCISIPLKYFLLT